MIAPGASESSTQQLRALEQRLKQLDADRAELLRTIEECKRSAARETKPTQVIQCSLLGRALRDSSPVTPDEQVALFLQLFRCRERIYPKRWENAKSGKGGYAPACRNEWVQPLCQKPTMKCTNCSHQAFLPLDEEAARGHLQGQSTIGTYAIDENDTCVFLACDFDGPGWREDVSTYRESAKALGIDVAVERSRSGQGAHAWISFDGRVPARMARNLGTLILSHALEVRPHLSMASFDRFFPSQDYLPKGGFGNLIALPLQNGPRELGNSCFLDEQGAVVQDQWEYLTQVKRPTTHEVQRLLERFVSSTQGATATRHGGDDVAGTTDRALLHAGMDSNKEGAPTILETVELTIGCMIHVSLKGVPQHIVGRLRKTATFPNPEFYKRQRMRMQTYPHTRFIFSGELRPDELVLPRGLLDQIVLILEGAGAQIVTRDERLARRRMAVAFAGELTQRQKEAVNALKNTDTGVLVAPPGFGKTVVGCALIAERGVSTLVLVHRQPLLDQWKESMVRFLGLDSKDIGILGGTKRTITGRLDLVMLQTLTRMGDICALARHYTHVIINQMPQRADRGWRWKRIMYGLNGVLFRHQAPAGFAVTFRSVRDPHGEPIVCGLTYAVRHYVYLGGNQQNASYLWYCASAPGKILTHYLTTHFGQPTSVEPRDIGKIALDLTIQESIQGGYHGRMGLHADPNGGAKLLSLYSQYGMTALPDGSLPPTLMRTILQGRGAKGYFYFDEAGALSFSQPFSQPLTSWR